MSTQHHLGLLGGDKPLAIRLNWAKSVEEACYPLHRDNAALQQRPADPAAARVPLTYAAAQKRKQRTVEDVTANSLARYLTAKLPPNALQEILEHAKPESLFVHQATLNADQTAIRDLTVRVNYPTTGSHPSSAVTLVI